jgi:Flp pilus assembly protein TadD
MQRADREGRDLPLVLAQTYVAKGSYEAATPLLTRLLRDEPREPLVHLLFATVLRERGLFAQAEHEFRRVLELSPTSAEARAGLGLVHDLQGRPDEAEREHRAAIALDPGRAAFWNNLGFSLFVARHTEEAVVALLRALSLDPGLAIAYNNLGFAYAQKKDYASARRAFTTAGGLRSALYNLALACERNGDPAMAASIAAELALVATEEEARR